MSVVSAKDAAIEGPRASAGADEVVFVDAGRGSWIAEFAAVFADYAESQGRRLRVARVRARGARALASAAVVDVPLASVDEPGFLRAAEALRARGFGRDSLVLVTEDGDFRWLYERLREGLETDMDGQVRLVWRLPGEVSESQVPILNDRVTGVDGLLLRQPEIELLEQLGSFDAAHALRLAHRRMTDWTPWPPRVEDGFEDEACMERDYTARHALRHRLAADAPQLAVDLLRRLDYVAERLRRQVKEFLLAELGELLERWGPELDPQILVGLERLERAVLGLAPGRGDEREAVWNAMLSECGGLEGVRAWFGDQGRSAVQLLHPLRSRSPARVLCRHRAAIAALACSATGEVACGGGGRVRRFLLERRRFEQREDMELCALICEEGRFISGGEGVTLWADREHARGHVLLDTGQGAQVRSLAHVGGELLVGHEDGFVERWTEAGELLARQRVIEREGENEAVEFIVELEPGCIALGDGTYVYLCEGERAPERYSHEGCVTVLAALPELGVAACGDHVGGLYVWDYRQDRQTLRFAGHAGRVNALHVSAEGWLISASDDGSVGVWDPRSGEHLASLRGHSDAVTALAMAPTGELLSAGADCRVRAWRPARRRGSHESPYLGACAQGQQGPISGLAWVDEYFVAAAALDGTLALWDCRSGDLCSSLPSADVDELRVGLLGLVRSPSGLFVAATPHAGIRVYRVEGGELRSAGPPLVAAEGGSFVTGFCMGPEELVVASDLHGMLRVWDLDTREQVLSLEGNGKPLVGHALRDDGSIATASAHSLWIWDPGSGEILARADQLDAQPRHIAVGPGGCVVFLDERGQLRSWEPERARFVDWDVQVLPDRAALSVLGSGLVLCIEDHALQCAELRQGAGVQTLLRGQVRFTSVLCRGAELVVGDGLGNLWFLDVDWSRVRDEGRGRSS